VYRACSISEPPEAEGAGDAAMRPAEQLRCNPIDFFTKLQAHWRQRSPRT
jgi:hypothetical protein